MTVQEFESELKENAARCDALAAQMKESGPEYGTLYPLVRRYLYLKFMLFDGDEGTEDILALAERSVEHIAQLKKGGLKFKDHSGTCGSISSSVTKKILLLIALQKALGIQFEKNETADITTIPELARQIAAHM